MGDIRDAQSCFVGGMRDVSGFGFSVLALLNPGDGWLQSRGRAFSQFCFVLSRLKNDTGQKIPTLSGAWDTPFSSLCKLTRVDLASDPYPK